MMYHAYMQQDPDKYIKQSNKCVIHSDRQMLQICEGSHFEILIANTEYDADLDTVSM